jgi:hypothetical protein
LNFPVRPAAGKRGSHRPKFGKSKFFDATGHLTLADEKKNFASLRTCAPEIFRPRFSTESPRFYPMKSKVPFILVALVTASLAYAAITYAGGSKSGAKQDNAECCDPQAGPSK